MKQSAKLAGLCLVACGVATAARLARQKSSSDASDRQAIEALNRKVVETCNAMDNADYIPLWADDGVDLIQGLAPMVGKPAIAAWLNGLTEQTRGAKMEYCTVDWQQLKISGDWAYEWGISKQKIDFPPPQKSFANEGKMLLILKRQPTGEWKIELESWNSGAQREN